MIPQKCLIDVKLGDAQMTYLQCVIQEGNLVLFKQIMASEAGTTDFITSRDLYSNTCLHYVALFDDEDFIIQIINLVGKSQEFAFQLKEISLAQNTENRSAMNFFDRGKSDSYINLHETLQDLQVGHGLTNNDLSLILTRLQNTQKMRRTPSLARMPSETNLAARRNKKPSLTLSSSLASLRSQQRVMQTMSLAPIAERVFTVKEGSYGGSIEEMENELASPY